MIYVLVFEGGMTDGEKPEDHACQTLPFRLSEALPILVLHEWAGVLWEAGVEHGLIGELTTGGDSSAGFSVQINEKIWAE